MNIRNNRALRLLVALLALCLAFGQLGATGRQQKDEPEIAELSPVFDESAADIQNEPSPEVVQPRTIEVAVVEEEEEIPVPARSCYCNRVHAGFYDYYSGELYVCVQDVMAALYPSARFSEQDGALTVQAGDIQICAPYGEDYFISNGRYLYAPAGVIKTDSGVYLPAEGVARCFGGTVTLDEENERLDIISNSIEPLSSGDEFYNEDDVYWLSHIIYSEAGCESFMGMVAVGNVVMNRIASTVFKETDIKSTIFSAGQFDPVANGSINLTPTDEAVAAAKVVLEGYKVVSDDTLFFATSMFAGAYICTTWIGNHCFMALA